MAYAVDILRKEHSNMQRLLALLEHQITLVEQAGEPDYELIKSICGLLRRLPRKLPSPQGRRDLRQAERAESAGR